MKTKFKITLKKDYIPIDYFQNLLVAAGMAKHVKSDCSYDVGNYWEVELDDKNLNEAIDILNTSLPKSKTFFEIFGKDAFIIETRFYPTGSFSSQDGNLKINEIKYNLGTVEFIRDEKKD